MSGVADRLARLSPERRAALQELLRQRPAAPAEPQLVAVPRDGSALPLSFAQRRLWYIDQLEPGSAAYNVHYALRLRGRFDPAVLERAVTEIVRRHETLRTVFAVEDGEPVQVIRDAAPVAVPVTDLRGMPADEREPELRRLARAEAELPFDLAAGPLLRVAAVRLDEAEWGLLFTMHHIVSDGWSTGVLVRELSELYDALTAGREPALPELPVQYADFAAWQRAWLAGATLEAKLGWWRDRLAGAPPLLEVPTDRPRPQVQDPRGGSVDIEISAGATRELRALSRREGATAFMALLAAWQLLLARYSGQDDVSVGTPVAGRTRLETEPLIGFFVNTLVLRTDLSGEPSFRELLGRVKETTLGAFQHQEIPFERLVEELSPERSLGHSPLFQAMFALQNNQQGELRMGGLATEPLADDGGEIAKFDLMLALVEDGETVRGSLSFRAELWERATVERMAGHFVRLVEAVAADADRPVGAVSFVAAGEREQLLVGWNDTSAEIPRAAVHELFAERAAATPQAAAVVLGEDVVSYAELEARANRLARWLVERGVAPEERVAVCMDRSVEMLVGVLGVLKASAVYVPLDPSHPAERLRGVLEDAGVSRVLTVAGSGANLPAEARPLRLDEPATAAAVAAMPSDAPGVATDPEQLAYVIYTSGSTGRPKGVAVPHRAVVRLVRGTSYVPFAPDERIAQVSNVAFDAATFEIWGALLNGGCVVVIGREVSLVPTEFVAELRARRVTALFLTTALFNRIAYDVPGAYSTLRHVLFGGELVDPEAVRRVLETGGPGRLLHVYGPTETTTYASWHPVSAGDLDAATVPIGGPLGNTRLYVLDAQGGPVPAGIPGELFIGGAGVARGYLGRPELTAEKFVPDTFGDGGGRLYRTGDRVRWNAAGAVEFLGRVDTQVKIRGFRIEPGEVEAVLERHPGVREALVMPRELGPGGLRLVAYVVPADGDAAPAGLRAYLGGQLPEYMVPSAFVAMREMPLNANGKVDRRALPAPEPTADGAGYVAPRTAAEELLCGIWADVLRVERVGVHESFFELGGHSLLATQAVSRVRQAFGVELPLRALFEAPTPAALAERVEALLAGGAGTQAPPLVALPRDGRPLPLSFAQQRLWFIDRLEPGSAAYNMPYALRLRGRLDPAVLERSLAETVRRHETLRTVFATTDGEPVQVIRDAGPVAVPVTDLRSAPAEEREAEVRRMAREEAVKPFDLAAGPLLRVAAIRLDEADWGLLFTMHHVVSDGWSMGVLVREVSELYDAFSEGREPALPELPVQYADYAAWQRAWLSGATLEAKLGWWREQLAGAPPLLELPTDRPRPQTQDPRGGSTGFALSPEAAAGLRALSRREGATLFMTLLAGWQLLLSRYAGQEDVVVGTPIAGRTRVETEPLIGFFVNTLALRGDLSGGPTFRELLARARESTLGAYAHQEVPFERLVEELAPERSLAHSPLFQVVFTLQRGEGGAPRLGGVEMEPLGEGGSTTVRFDLSLSVAEQGERLGGGATFRSTLFDEATVGRLLAHYAALLEAVAADPERRCAEVPFLAPDERAQVLRGWNATGADYPRDSFPDRFERQAELRPDAPAVLFEGERVSYAELNRRANRLAHHLAGLGVRADARVGICVDRSVEMVVAVLAVLKAGGAFVPLDPEYPAERLAYMLEDSAPQVLLAHGPPADRLRGGGVPVLDLVADAAAWAGRPESDPERGETGPEQLAYVIYTSGSTGRPKGVANVHRNVANRLAWMQDAWGLEVSDAVLQKTTLSFDAFAREILWPLSVGARIVVMAPGAHRDPAALVEIIRRERIAVVSLVPSLLQVFLERPESAGCTGLKRVMCGGEALPQSLARRFHERLPGVALYNLYGPSEAATATAARVGAGEGAEARVPIGGPIGNTRAYLLDPAGEPVPAGVAGELYIGGAGVARGYLGRPELTAEKFVPDPFSGEAGGRLYRTGDLGRWLPDGAIDYLGRNDDQVKVRGFRVEPGEIEARLLEHPEVQQAVALVREDSPGDRRLVAYHVGAPLEAEALRTHLAARLPEHMVPAAFVRLEALPLTPNGKIDRRALPAPQWTAGAAYAPPATPTEELLCGIWAEVLGVERVGTAESFFELGGHSLLATRVVSRAWQAFGVELPLRALFEAPTVAGLAARVDALLGEGAGAGAPPLVPVPRDGGELPLSFAQRRLWFIDQLQPGSAAYNIPFALRLRGRLDPAVLERSVTEIVRRHETLRTVFRAGADGEPVQVIRDASPVALPVADLRGLPADAREAEVLRLGAGEAARPFDLAAGPLLRTLAVRLDREEWGVLFTLHHIVSDGWSTGVLVREVSALYAAIAEGREPALPELPVQYADYAAWQRGWLTGEALETRLGWWRDRLAGAPPLLELPTDRPRSGVQDPRGASVGVRLPAEVADGLRALSRREGATVFMTLLAAWQLLLSRYSGQPDVSVGTPIAGRTRLETEPLIGFFINTLVLRTDLSGEPTFRELLARVRETTLGAFQHQELPFERLVEELAPERSLAHTPLYQAMFVMQNNAREALSLGALRAEPLGSEVAAATKLDLTLSLEEAEGGEIRGGATYRTELFDESTVRRMLEHFGTLLRGVAADPGRAVSALPMLGAGEREELLARWNSTDRAFPRLCIHELFAAQAARTPDAPALTFGGEHLSYAELERTANRLARHLRERGVRPETRVALALERSPEMVVGMLAILKAGGVYVPLDPTHPAERLEYQLEDSAATLLVTTRPVLERLGSPAAEPVLLDRDRAAIERMADTAPESGVGPENLAYVIYTSGSTGRPKGVMTRHAGAANYLAHLAAEYGLGGGDAVLQLATVSFDASIRDVLGPLTAGARLVLVRGDEVLDPARLLERMREQGVTAVMAIVPSVLRPLLAEAAAAPVPLRLLLVSGEPLTREDCRRARAAFGGGVRVVNLWGATECTMSSTLHTAGADEAGTVVPLGGPIANTRVYVLDAAGEPVPPGVPGEAFIATTALSRGYQNRPELTAERFLPDPFSAEPGARLYRVGDRVRRRRDGVLEFLGRVDQQVKVQGVRVEPGEVEAVLRSHPAVGAAAVVAQDDGAGGSRLAAYVVAAAGRDAPAAELRSWLAERLPTYMVPGAWVEMDALPRLPNGKLDRRALPAAQPGAQVEYAPPGSEVEELLCEIWLEVLGALDPKLERVGIHDNFFDLGGHSLLATRVAARLRQALGIDMPLRALFQHPTVAQLAGPLEDQLIAGLEEADLEERLSGLDAAGG